MQGLCIPLRSVVNAPNPPATGGGWIDSLARDQLAAGIRVGGQFCVRLSPQDRCQPNRSGRNPLPRDLVKAGLLVCADWSHTQERRCGAPGAAARSSSRAHQPASRPALVQTVGQESRTHRRLCRRNRGTAQRSRSLPGARRNEPRTEVRRCRTRPRPLRPQHILSSSPNLQRSHSSSAFRPPAHRAPALQVVAGPPPTRRLRSSSCWPLRCHLWVHSRRYRCHLLNSAPRRRPTTHRCRQHLRHRPRRSHRSRNRRWNRGLQRPPRRCHRWRRP
jgi:hypothetical protein